MKATRREQEIIALLESRGELSVKDLSSILDVSLSTLRKQLAVMQDNGLVIRTYGGVMSVNRVPDETFESKLHKNITEKRRIAEKARSLVPSGAALALGSGTTVFGLANLLDDLPHATVYTNSMQAADYLSRAAGLEVHISGGIIRSHTGTIIGNEVAEYFRSLRQVDYAFIGCDAIDARGEVFSDNLAVAHITSLSVCDGLIPCRSANDIADSFQFVSKVIYA